MLSTPAKPAHHRPAEDVDPLAVQTAKEIPVPPVSARVWTFKNGLTLIVDEDHSAPVASLQAWCQTGSIHEDKHLGAGLSHILEHMLFKGTEHRSTSEFALKVQDQGGYINAYTSYDRTVYWIDIPSKGVATALDLLSDAMVNSTLPPLEYRKEQEVIRREFAMGYDDPDRMAMLQLMDTAFQAHPYRHPVIGHIDIFNQLKRDDVMEYYKLRYVPNNLFFVVVGDVDAQAVHDQLEKYFADYPRKSLPPVYIPGEPQQLGKRRIDTEFPTELTRLGFAWHIPSVTSPDIPALDVLSTIMGDGASSRLNQRLREQLRLVHSISAYCYTPGESGLFGIDANLDAANREAAEQAIAGVLADLRQNGVSSAEIEKAKRRALGGHLSSLTTMRGKAADLGSNWLITRNLNFSNEYLAALQRVTGADILRVLRVYFEDSNLTVSSLNPIGSLGHAGDAIAAAEAGEIQKFTLSNGLRLLVREDPRLPLVSMLAAFKAGILAETPANNGITKLCSRVLLKGTESRTAEEIFTRIESLGGSIGADSGNNSISAAVRVMKPDIDTGLELLSDVLLRPAFPEDEIEIERQFQLASLKAEDEEVTVTARNLMRATLYPGHPYSLRLNGSPETVSRLTRDQLVAFHRQFLVGKNGVIAVFGDVKAEEIRAGAERLFASMPAGEEALTQPPLPAPLDGSQTVRDQRNKAQAILMVAYRGADLFSPDRTALELIDEACSDLGSRFFVRIREKMGLAYFVGTSQLLGLVPGPFTFYLGTDPEKLEAVQAELLDEIGILAKEGLTETELNRAREKAIGQQAIRNQSTDALAYSCALDELYGVGCDYYKSERALIEAVTLDRAREVAHKYFLDKPRVIAIVAP
ncbi:MAG TPA: pitrilysin family protein [Chthoniobacteraceae bacterium]|nr:pitrilysin family protein [Chthoniobacteraceae bacterium]